MEALKAARKEQSGFDAAVKSDGGEPSIQTSEFLGLIGQMQRKAVDPKAKEAFDWLLSALRTPPAIKGAKAVDAVSIDRMRKTLESLNSRIETVLPSTNQELTTLREQLLSKMETTHPQMKAAREAYAKLSRPLDVYRDSGALAKAVMTDPYNTSNFVDTTKIVGALFNKTEGSANALGRLIGKNPELRDSARQYFNYKLFGAPGAEKSVTPTIFSKFLRDNKLALDQSGLTTEFATLKGAQDARKAAVEAAKLKQGAAGDALKVADKAHKATVDDLADTLKLKETAQAFKSKLDTFNTELDHAADPATIASITERIAKSLVKGEQLSQEQYGNFLDEVHKVQKMDIDHKHMAYLIKRALQIALVASTGGAAAEYVGHRFNF